MKIKLWLCISLLIALCGFANADNYKFNYHNEHHSPPPPRYHYPPPPPPRVIVPPPYYGYLYAPPPPIYVYPKPPSKGFSFQNDDFGFRFNFR